MAELSSADMAFSGFGLIGRRPLMVLGWGGLYLVMSLAIGLLGVVLFGAQLRAMSAASVPGSSDPTAVLGMMAQLAPFFLLVFLLVLLFYAVITVSCYRAMLHPEQGAPLHLAFGGAELRQFLLMIIFFLLFLVGYIGCFIVGAIVGGIGAAIGGAIGGAGGGIIAGVSIFVAVLVAIGLFLMFAVRLSLAAPATFAQNTLVVFGSWSMTRGKFWALFGGYFLNWVVVIVLYIVVVVCVVLVTVGSTGFSLQGLQQMNEQRMASVGAMFAPIQLVSVIVTSFVSAAVYALILAPAAFAYRALVQPDAAATFD